VWLGRSLGPICLIGEALVARNGADIVTPPHQQRRQVDRDHVIATVAKQSYRN
jgi:hypothetical protein